MNTPTAVRGWDEVLDRLERKPAQRLLMKVLRSLSGGGPERTPMNGEIADGFAGLGHARPSGRAIKAILHVLEREEGLIALEDLQALTASRAGTTPSGGSPGSRPSGSSWRRSAPSRARAPNARRPTRRSAPRSPGSATSRRPTRGSRRTSATSSSTSG
jgi:hypothetical protein